MTILLRLLPLCAMPIALALSAQTLPVASRGQMLYDTHCIACHSKEVHWRARRLVSDWPSLAAETRRWQANLGLGWSNDEIADVVKYLNRTIYRFPDQAAKQLG